jgi:hypothetical protein
VHVQHRDGVGEVVRLGRTHDRRSDHGLFSTQVTQLLRAALIQAERGRIFEEKVSARATERPDLAPVSGPPALQTPGTTWSCGDSTGARPAIALLVIERTADTPAWRTRLPPTTVPLHVRSHLCERQLEVDQ